MRRLFGIFVFFVYASAGAQTELESLVISTPSSSYKKEEINKVETLERSKIDQINSASFAEIVGEQSGIDTQTSCAFCGSKRITINGLKGEHTQINVDGLSLHSTVSSMYGVEAIPVELIESIDVYRGAGASLTHPESIGGTLSVNTVSDFTPRQQWGLGSSDKDNTQLKALTVHRWNDQWSSLFGGQLAHYNAVDSDQNNVSESPEQKMNSFFTKTRWQKNDSTIIDLRISYSDLLNIGGNTKSKRSSQAPSSLAEYEDFENYDVRQKYLGDPLKITDDIAVNRLESALTGSSILSPTQNIQWGFGHATQLQDNIYSHGYDYSNKDVIWNFFFKNDYMSSDEHLWTFGIDHKSQMMRSKSDFLYGTSNLRRDDFNYQSAGLYIQDTWFLSDNTELATAVRTDTIRTHWLGFGKKLEKTFAAPRLYLKHQHSSQWTSRLGAGIGYRAPLSLFESQHGTDHYGFEINIDRFEEAQSLTYSLIQHTEVSELEFGAHTTRLFYMAYGEDRASQSKPMIFKNAEESYLISTFELRYARAITASWTGEFQLEFFRYPVGYKEKLPVAAVEDRLRWSLQYQLPTSSFSFDVEVIGERNLKDYDYGSHYNRVYEDVGLNLIAEDQKKQTAPLYGLLHFKYQTYLNQSWQLQLNVDNIFDYTQTSAGDSPTTWDLHGQHYHLDNFHLWGPNKGREFKFLVVGKF